MNKLVTVWTLTCRIEMTIKRILNKCRLQGNSALARFDLHLINRRTSIGFPFHESAFPLRRSINSGGFFFPSRRYLYFITRKRRCLLSIRRRRLCFYVSALSTQTRLSFKALHHAGLQWRLCLGGPQTASALINWETGGFLSTIIWRLPDERFLGALQLKLPANKLLLCGTIHVFTETREGQAPRLPTHTQLLSKEKNYLIWIDGSGHSGHVHDGSASNLLERLCKKNRIFLTAPVARCRGYTYSPSPRFFSQQRCQSLTQIDWKQRLN